MYGSLVWHNLLLYVKLIRFIKKTYQFHHKLALKVAANSLFTTCRCYVENCHHRVNGSFYIILYFWPVYWLQNSHMTKNFYNKRRFKKEIASFIWLIRLMLSFYAFILWSLTETKTAHRCCKNTCEAAEKLLFPSAEFLKPFAHTHLYIIFAYFCFGCVFCKYLCISFW